MAPTWVTDELSKVSGTRSVTGQRGLGQGGKALEEQRSEKYWHALIVVVSIGVRAGQPNGTDAWLSSRLVSHARICRS
jgi:hypothetical protein